MPEPIPVPRRRARARRAAALRLLAGLLLPPALMACRALPPPAVGTDAAAAEEAIRAALAASADAWNRADLEGHLAPYADSAMLMASAGPLRGRQRMGEALRRAFWADGRPRQSLALSELEVRPIGEAHALVLGRFRLSGGGEAERSGRFSLVWGRTAEGWRILHDHSS